MSLRKTVLSEYPSLRRRPTSCAKTQTTVLLRTYGPACLQLCDKESDLGLGTRDGLGTSGRTKHQARSTKDQSSVPTRTRDRMSLRKTVLIRVPKPSPPTNELCQNTDYGFAADIRSRLAFPWGTNDSRPGTSGRTKHHALST